MRPWIFAAAVTLFAGASGAAPPGSAADEERVQALQREIRCPVCAGQSVAESDVPVSRDIRRFIERQVLLGEPDAAIKSALVERYGRSVLFDPGVSASTLPLWFAPWLFAGLGGIAIWRLTRRQKDKT